MGLLHASPEWEKVSERELDAFRRCLHDEPIEIEHLDWLTSGFSGSPVALIRVEATGKPPAEAILKFCKDGDSEAQKISSAYENAPPEFSRAHMVKPRRSFRLQESTAVLLEIAGGDLSSYKSIAEFTDKRELADICAVVVRSLLGQWNVGTIRRNKDVTVGKFLEDVIGADRIERTSKLARFASEAQIGWGEQWIRRKGRPDWLFNPLALATHTADTKIDAIIGFGHGDLSVHNVLVPTVPELSADGFLLIDYGTFDYQYPLTRDPMYLLVSLARQWLKDTRLPSNRSSALAREVARAGPQTPDLGLMEYREVIETIFETGRKWAASQTVGRHWISQSFLALAGSALTFIGRDMRDVEPAAMNDWLFDLAAVVAKEHLASYAPVAGVAPAPVGGATAYDVMQHTNPFHATPAPPTAASAANAGQASADPAVERPAEGDNAYDDRPDPVSALLESTVVRLGDALRAVGPPPVPPPRSGGIGRWMVSLGYWTDGAESMLSEIASFTYRNCNDSPDRFARAADDVRSAITKIVDRLSADATTSRDAAALAGWATELWSQLAHLLPLSMEACGLGHVLLAAGDQMITEAALPGALPAPAGIPADPGLGNLMAKLDAVRSALEPLVDGFLRQRPSAHAADLLFGRLEDLFKQLDRTYLPQIEGGQRVNLERVRNAVRLGAIALSRLIDSTPPDDELSVIHEEISRLLRVLDDILPIVDSRGGS